MSLVIENLWKGFVTPKGPQHVLRDVSITVEPGEFVSLIGHSGCGKSTLLNIVAGLDTADAGQATLDGAKVQGPGPERVSERYLGAVGLWEHRHKRPYQVSGGIQQRTAVARAFAVEPRVLLLDEPFGALDALTRGRLQSQLIDLWQSKSETEIVVMVTHGIDEATLLSDRIVVLGNQAGPSIIEMLTVPIERPRATDMLLHDPRARIAHDRLMKLLRLDDSHGSAA